MGTLYVDTGGSATNSGSSDQNSADLSGSAATAVTTTITLDGSPTLTGLTTSGDNQSAIYLSQATNANRKIFWITAFDNTLKTVTVDLAPTGITSSAWAIGGRHVLTKASIEGAVRNGDIVIFNNSPASDSGTVFTIRAYSVIKGKTGVRPVLTCTGTSNCLADTGAGLLTKVENLELAQQGASGSACLVSAGRIYNVKISDAGTNGFSSSIGYTNQYANEVSGVGTNGITTAGPGVVFANYIHDNGDDGIEVTSVSTPFSMYIAFNIFDTNAARGIYFSGTPASNFSHSIVLNNVIYSNGNSGLEVADIDSYVDFLNNIFMNNGDAAGEYNVEWVSTAEPNALHYNNIFNTASAGGSGNLSNVTANSTELTTDPLFTNASGGDFSIGVNSPAKAAGYPGTFLGGPVGYLDIGAVQRKEGGAFASASA